MWPALLVLAAVTLCSPCLAGAGAGRPLAVVAAPAVVAPHPPRATLLLSGRRQLFLSPAPAAVPLVLGMPPGVAPPAPAAAAAPVAMVPASPATMPLAGPPEFAVPIAVVAPAAAAAAPVAAVPSAPGMATAPEPPAVVAPPAPEDDKALQEAKKKEKEANKKLEEALEEKKKVIREEYKEKLAALHANQEAAIEVIRGAFNDTADEAVHKGAAVIDNSTEHGLEFARQGVDQRVEQIAAGLNDSAISGSNHVIAQAASYAQDRLLHDNNQAEALKSRAMVYGSSFTTNQTEKLVAEATASVAEHAAALHQGMLDIAAIANSSANTSTRAVHSAYGNWLLGRSIVLGASEHIHNAYTNASAAGDQSNYAQAATQWASLVTEDAQGLTSKSVEEANQAEKMALPALEKAEAIERLVNERAKVIIPNLAAQLNIAAGAVSGAAQQARVANSESLG